MNILKHELRAGLKVFLFWALGLFILVYAGVVKSTGISAGGENVTVLLSNIPRIVQAVFGMAGADMRTFGGYYGVLTQYTFLVAAIYAVHLGSSAVSREASDKTYEFVFTKPRSRSFILARKLLAGFVYLTVFCALNFVFSAAAITALDIPEDMTARFALFSTAAWLLSLPFFALGALFAAVSENSERGSRLGNGLILVTFILAVVCDLMDNGEALRFFTPFRYFPPRVLLDSRIEPLFAALCIIIAVSALLFAFRAFERRDLRAR